MKKYIVSFLLLAFSTLIQAEDKLSLDLRALYTNLSYDTYFRDSEAFATSLKLKYKKELMPNLEAGVAIGVIEDFGRNDINKQDMTYLHSDIYTGINRSSFYILHQAYLKYNICDSFCDSYIQLGRFEFSSPLIDSNDLYMLSNTFEGGFAKLDINNFNLQFGQLTKMSGTFDAAYDGASYQSMSRSLWMHKADVGINNWPNPYADFGVKDSGVSFIGLTYDDEVYKFQIWDYYAHDVMNSIYTEFGMNFDAFAVGLQYSSFSEVGQMKENINANSKIGYDVWGAKVSTTLNNVLQLQLAYLGVSDHESAHLWGSWGGNPYFVSGMKISYFDTSLRGASIYSFDTTLRFIRNLSTTFHIAYYDLNKEYTKLPAIGVNNGEDYMLAYGIENNYALSEDFSFMLTIAGRKLDSGNESMMFRSILKYAF